MAAEYWRISEVNERERSKPYDDYCNAYNARVERVQKLHSIPTTDAQKRKILDEERFLLQTQEILVIFATQVARMERMYMQANEDVAEQVGYYYKWCEAEIKAKQLERELKLYKDKYGQLPQ